MNKKLRANCMLFITAAIWGFAFSAQSVGAEYLTALYFNGLRFCLGCISLLPLIFFVRKKDTHNAQDSSLDRCQNAESANKTPCINEPHPAHKTPFYGTKAFLLCIGGTLSGLCLFFGATMQQLGIETTTAANAGFITGLYIVLVPLLCVAFKKFPPLSAYIGVILAVLGLYFLCIGSGGTQSKGFAINTGDKLMLIGSFFWAFQILLVDCFSKKVSPLELSAFQFAVCGILSLSIEAFKSPLLLTNVKAALLPLLYGGLCSVGIGYTLQTVAQKDTDPTEASLIMSFETVFSAVGGYFILGQKLSARAILGCILIFAAITVSQMQPKKKQNL